MRAKLTVESLRKILQEQPANASTLDDAWVVPRPRPPFGHGAHVVLEPRGEDREPVQLFGCYHVSQQNTFTGRLTPAMLEDVLSRAAGAAGLGQ